MTERPMPRLYDEGELCAMAARLTAEFVEERRRSEEALAAFYHDAFVKALESVDAVLDRTGDLTRLREDGARLLAEGMLPTLRNMDRPTVSEDDFKSMSDVGTTAPSRFEDDEAAAAALEYLDRNLNKDLFPWLGRGVRPSAEQRHAARVAVAALMAEQRTKTEMRGASSKVQEGAVRQALVDGCGMALTDGPSFNLVSEGPRPGEVFRRETRVAGTKADVVLGLFDGRIMCLECKVSNSEVNSYKRLNHEVIDKVAKWTGEFGRQCVPGAVLKGCFKASNLVSAQGEGAFLFWSSSLDTLVDFVNETKRR